jgi:AsmA family
MRRVFGSSARRPWRWLLIAILVIFLLATLAIAIFVATFDANSHKTQIANIVEEKTGRALSIPGKLRLSLFPKVMLDLDRAIMNEKNSTNPFATIEALKVSLRLWPLLKSEVMLDQVEIGNFSVNLKRFANGTMNFDDLLSKDESSSPLRLDLAGLSIKNGSLKFVDEMAQRTLQLQQIKIVTGRLTENVPAPVDATFLLTSDNPTAALQTKLNAQLQFDLKRKRYRMNNLRVNANGEANGMSPIAIGLGANIDADLQASNFIAQALTGTLEGKIGSQILRSAISIARASSQKNQTALENLDVKFSRSEGAQSFELHTTLPKLNHANDKIEAAKLNAAFSLQQDALKSSGKLTSDVSLDLATRNVSVPALQFASKTSRENMIVDFSASGPLALSLQTGTLDASQLGGEWKMQSDQDQVSGRWSAPLTANIGDGNFAIRPLQGDWSGNLAGAKVSGALRVPVEGNWREYGGRIPTIDLETTITWPDSGLEANIHADLETSSSSETINAKGVAMKASGYTADGKWQANLSSPVKMDLNRQLAAFTKLAGRVLWKAIDKNAQPFNLKLSGAGKVDLANEDAGFNLNARLDQSNFNGNFGLNGWTDPSYRVDAKLDRLDLDRYFPAKAKLQAHPTKKVSPPAKLDLTFLKRLKIDGRISIGQLKSAGTTARNVRIDMESVTPKKTKP